MGTGRDASSDGKAAGRVLLGTVSGVRGLKGEVRIKSFTQDPEAIADYGPLSDEKGARTFRLSVTGLAKGQVIARIEGVATREAAEALKGVRLYAARDALPEPAEGEYYIHDLVGLEARGEGDESLGRVVRVDDFGSAPVLELESGRLLPFTDAVCPEVNLKAGIIRVRPPEEVEAPPGGHPEEGE